MVSSPVVPEVADLGVDDQVGVLAEALRLCQNRRAFLLIDPPKTWTTLDAARAGADRLASLRNSRTRPACTGSAVLIVTAERARVAAASTR